MEIESEVQRVFQDVAPDVANDKACVKHCAGLCTELSLRPNDLPGKWDTFITKEMQSSLSGASALSATAPAHERMRAFEAFLKQSLEDQRAKAKALVSPAPRAPLKRKASDFEMYGLAAPAPKHVTSASSKRVTSPSQSESTPASAPVRQAPGQLVSRFNEQLSHERSAHDTPSFEDKFEAAKFVRGMVDNFHKKMDVLQERFEVLSKALQEKEGISEVMPVGTPSQVETWYAGRICCEQEAGSNNEKLGWGHTQLESGKPGHQARVRLDLSAVDGSFFPGQIVLVCGVSQTRVSGSTLIVKRVVRDCSQPAPSLAVPQSGALGCIVSHGPYAAKPEGMKPLNFQPLTELLDQALNNNANLVVLVGPFVDVVEAPEVSDLTYGEMFEKQVMSSIRNHPLVLGEKCHVVVVPSTREAHHTSIFPQPPFRSSEPLSPTLHLVSNPSLFSVGGVVFGVTGHDIVWDLNKAVITRRGALPRLVGHAALLLEQRSFYPVHPFQPHVVGPNVELDVAVDTERLAHFGMCDASPHVLIVPSMMNEFVADVQGVVCVNPGRLMKSAQGGSFARLTVHPSPEGVASSSVAGHTKVDIMRFSVA